MLQVRKHGSLQSAGLVAALALIVTFSTKAAWSQADAGTIRGQVTDPAGAAVPNVMITVTNQATGVNHQITTDTSGNYSLPGLPSGTYTVASKVNGFQTSREKDVVLDASDTRNADFHLVIGSVTQEVVVTSVAQSQVETSNAQIASTITSTQIENIPLNGRNYEQLLRLLPGTVSATLDPFAIALSATSTYVNGVRGASILNMADGIILEDVAANISVISVPNADSIAETRVLAASFGADNPSPYGGATINVVTKTGGQSFHGNIFEFNRNTIFNAKQDFATSRLPLHFNDYGFTLGGPIFLPGRFNRDRKKLFFFVSEEWKITHQNNLFANNVPTATQRSGIFPGGTAAPVYQPGTKTLYPAGSCTQNAAILNNAATGYCVPQSAFSANGPRFLAAYPLPNAAGASNYIISQTALLDNRQDRYNLDYSATEKDLISIRFSRDSNNQSNPAPIGIIRAFTPRPAFLYSVNYTRTLTPNVLNSFIIGETENKLLTTTVTSVYTPAALGLTFQQPLAGVVNAIGTAPGITITGLTGIGGGADRKALESLLLSDDLSWVKGNHTLKFGTYIQHSKNDEHNTPAGNTQGAVTFSTAAAKTSNNAIADTLLGNFSQYSQSSSPGFFLVRYLVSEVYAQDNWRVSKRLALDYGLRYSYSQLPYSPINNLSYFDPNLYSSAAAPIVSTTNGSLSGSYDPYNGLRLAGSGFTAATSTFYPGLARNSAVNALFTGTPKTLAPTPKFELAPRLGLAFDPMGDGKASIRVGFGLFFFRPGTNAYSSVVQNLPFNTNSFILNGSIDSPGGGTGAAFPTSLYSVPKQFKPAYLMTRNLGIQRQLPKGMLLDVNYVGNQALHMPLILNINQLQPGTTNTLAGKNSSAFRTYKGYTDIDVQVDADTSNYNSLQSTLSRRVSRGLNFSTSFTWSKTMEGTSQASPGATLPENSYNYKADYSVADIHRSKVTTGNVVYEMPFFRHSTSHLLVEGLAGWTVTGVFQYQTGAPLNPVLSTDVAGIGAANGVAPGQNQRLQIVPGADPYTHQDCGGLNKFPICQFLNPAAFTLPATGTFGNASRNYVRGPAYTQTDVSTYKHFRFSETMNLELRGEAFNIFNRDSLTSVATTFGPANFGQVTASTTGRILQLGAKFAF